jgi:hypothetical protein
VSLHSSPGLARTWHIRADGGGDAPTIQAGIDSASVGDDVLVAAGNYTWSTQGKATDLYGPTMIEVGPGIRLHSESGASVTVLNAQLEGRVLVCRFCTGVEGFTITGGRTLRNSSYGGVGGGIFVLGGEPLVAGNTVCFNYAEGTGGGIGIHGGRGPGSSPVIRSNSVLWNTAGFRTGGIEISGGDSTLVANNTVAGNFGGGIACVNCSATIERNIIAESGRSLDGLVDGFGLLCLLFEGEGDSVITQCNILWNNSGGDLICGTDGGGNLVDDPKFCASDPDRTGLRFLRPDSPALPQNNSCNVLLGATGEGCAVTDASDPSRSAATLTIAPNPLTSRTTIRYSLAPGARSARMMVYTLAGRLVARILEGGSRDGSITWDGRDGAGVPVCSGMYIVRPESEGSTVARRLILIR